MSKGTRDVQLVIKARNEASRALDAISTSLDSLRGSQRKVEDGSRKTGGVLASLGEELTKLRRAAGGDNPLASLNASVEKANTAVGRLETSLARTTAEQRQLSAESDKAAASASRLAARQQQLSDRLASQRTNTQATKASFQQLSAEIAKGEQQLARYQSETQKFTDRAQRQQTALDRTRAKHAELTAAILRSDAPTAKQQAQMEKTEAQLRRQSAALAKTSQDHREYDATIARVRQSLSTLRASQSQAEAAFNRSAQAQQRTSQALGHVNAAARKNASEMSRLSAATQRTRQAADQQTQALARARAELDQLNGTARQAEGALGRVGTTIRRDLLRTLQDGRRQLGQYEKAWKDAQRQVGAAMAGSGGMGPPTQDTVRQQNAARAAKQAYDDQQQALARLRASLRAAGTDVNKLEAAHNRYAAALKAIDARTAAAASAEQRAAAARRGTASATRDSTRATDQNTAAVRQNAAAMARLERRGRRAMTWAQRMNGELIALAASFLGVYAAVEQLRGVTRAFLEVEAATNRMLVAMQGSEAVAGREMRFVRQEADRLGIQFGVLAQEYSKFSIAARNTSLEGAETRRIFKAVTEAGRVNKLTVDQMQGTFLALTQMLSKGAISMEELRQQLGERLPGAFNIAADAMGMTTAEFGKLVETGQVASEDFLPKFARELERVFGPHLSESLDTFTTDLGKFQNELFKAQERVARAGFIDGLRELLNTLSDFLRSDQGIRFLEGLGAAVGGVAVGLAVLVDNFGAVIAVLGTLIGMKLILPLFQGLTRHLGTSAAAARAQAQANRIAAAAAGQAGGAFGRMGAAANGAVAGVVRLRTSMIGFAGSLRTAQGRAVALTRTMYGLRTAFLALGGLPGLLVTGLSVGLGMWLSRSSDIVDITTEHERQMTALIDAYSRVAQEAGNWGNEVARGIEGLSFASARANFTRNLDAMAEQADATFNAVAGRIESSIAVFGDTSPEGVNLDMERKVVDLGKQMRAGAITAREYQVALDDILYDDRTSDRLRELIEANAEVTQGMVDVEKQALEAALIVESLGGSVEGLTQAQREALPELRRLAQEAGVLGDNAPVDPMAALTREMNKLREAVPSLGDELKMLEQIKGIDEILDTASAIKGIDQTGEAFQRLLQLAQRAKDEVRDAFDAQRFGDSAQAISTPGADSAQLSAQLIRQREGFREDPYWDVNAFRAGFGSDTVTLSDGTVKAVTEGMKVSVAEANRDLERRIGEFQDTVRRQVGDDAWSSLNPQQQAVLTSNAYNYGSLQDSLVEAVRSGSTPAVQNVLRSQASQNDGVNADRRNQEAYLFGQAGEINAEATREFVEEQIRLAEQQNQKAQEYNEQLDKTLERRAEDLQYVNGLTREMTIQRAAEDEREQAARANATLSREQLELIKQNAATAWDQAAAEKAKKEEKERQAAAEERINTLTQTRRDLMEQMEFFEGQGNTEAVIRLKEAVDGVTDSLREAIQAQIEFWEAQDGEKAAAMVAQLQNQKLGLQEVSSQAVLTAANIGKAFGEQLMSGANAFLSKIRETGDVLGSLKDSFRQFASDFLLRIAQMILQQMIMNGLMLIFNVLTGGAPAASGGGGGFMGGVMQGVGLNHDGGIAGSSNRSRTVSPGLFSNAMRYHDGGVAGLKANEVPTILERGEEVLTRDDARHRFNGGRNPVQGSGQSQVNLKNVNVFDAAAMLEHALADTNGQQVLLNYVNENSGTVRGALGM